MIIWENICLQLFLSVYGRALVQSIKQCYQVWCRKHIFSIVAPALWNDSFLPDDVQEAIKELAIVPGISTDDAK